MQRTFLIYADPGHAWIKVSKAFLSRTFGERWRQLFTCFSYERNQHVYLEEDQDAAVFVNRLRDLGIEPVFKEGGNCANRYSRIRNYPPLQPL